MTLDTAHMSEPSARASVDRARTHLEAAAEEVVRQVNGRAWLALGYESWDEMRAAEYQGAAVIVPRADRPELVARLRAKGLSQREIGDTIGVSVGTVNTDLRDGEFISENTAPRTDSLGRSRPTSYAPRVRELPPEQTRDSDGEATADDPPQVMAPVVEEPPLAPSALVPSEAVSAVLANSQSVQDAKYMHEFAKAMARSDDFLIYDAERVGRLGDEADVTSVEQLLESTERFLARMRAARTGLRVVKGGKA